MVAAFPVTEINRRRRPILRVPLPDDPQTTPRQRSSHITPAFVVPTSLTVRLRVSFFQWYRRYYTRCDAVESPILRRTARARDGCLQLLKPPRTPRLHSRISLALQCSWPIILIKYLALLEWAFLGESVYLEAGFLRRDMKGIGIGQLDGFSKERFQARA